MVTHNTSSTLDANFKEVYGDAIDKIVPLNTQLQRMIPFSQAYKVGDKYVVPAALTLEHGISYLGANYGVATLESAEAAVYKEAQVNPSGLLLRSSISYSAADRMASSKAAFKQWSSLLVKNMNESIRKHIEVGLLYGQTPLAQVSGSPTTSSNAATCTIAAADWAEGLWAGMEGARVDVWATDGTTNRTNDSTTAAYISAVDFDNRTVTIECANSTDAGNIADTDYIYFDSDFASGGSYNNFAGLKKIATNSGSLFNISAATYGLWKGVEYAVGSANLTLGKILKATAKAANRGLESNMCICVNPDTFATLGNDEAALRRHSGKVGKTENGVEALQFHFGGVSIDMIQHRYVKGGDAFGFPKDKMMRIGATDVTFRLPGAEPDRVFLHIPDKAGYELRARTEQALFCETPAQMIYFSGIVNT